MSKFLTSKKPTADVRLEAAAEAVTDAEIKRLSIDMTANMHKKLKQIAASRGVSMKELVLEALKKTVVGHD